MRVYEWNRKTEIKLERDKSNEKCITEKNVKQRTSERTNERMKNIVDEKSSVYIFLSEINIYYSSICV